MLGELYIPQCCFEYKSVSPRNIGRVFVVLSIRQYRPSAFCATSDPDQTFFALCSTAQCCCERRRVGKDLVKQLHDTYSLKVGKLFKDLNVLSVSCTDENQKTPDLDAMPDILPMLCREPTLICLIAFYSSTHLSYFSYFLDSQSIEKTLHLRGPSSVSVRKRARSFTLEYVSSCHCTTRFLEGQFANASYRDASNQFH